MLLCRVIVVYLWYFSFLLMEATVHQPKTPFCLHCNCCFRFFWQTEQLSHFLNPTFFLIVCFKNWCHSTKLKLKFNFNTKIYYRRYTLGETMTGPLLFQTGKHRVAEEGS